MASNGNIAGDVLHAFQRRFQHVLDRTVPHIAARWAALCVCLCVYALRVYSLDGWYIVTYGLGIYVLNLFIGFLSPQMDPETDGPLLPVNNAGEFRPFSRRVPEFRFWYLALRGLCIAFVMTFFSLFNIPVFWPILVVYFLVLFTLTMKNQIMHMIKYKYIPFSWGKARYGGKGKAGAAATEPRFTGTNLSK